jgi:hypothetical protein
MQSSSRLRSIPACLLTLPSRGAVQPTRCFMQDEIVATLQAVLNILQELIDKLETPPPLEVMAIEEVKPESDIGG